MYNHLELFKGSCRLRLAGISKTKARSSQVDPGRTSSLRKYLCNLHQYQPRSIKLSSVIGRSDTRFPQVDPGRLNLVTHTSTDCRVSLDNRP
ncbi:hypothetical protein HCN44_008203 [Aphidius gifuensis]|uniref:Uncharacterized protein n=1 Tax=Aphidius gifuensis TaxID=684658 RepID=A0A834XQG1_APHGI|nr:hypothetical protein HCN44_008203 [Aphidius gifuensis]